MFRAFQTLSGCRSFGFEGPNFISIADMHAYLCMVPFCDPERFLCAMRSLDALFMEHAAAQANAAKS